MSKQLPCKRCNGTGHEPDQTETGKTMRAMRNDAGLSLRELGALIGKSAPYISDLELGRRLWSSRMIREVEVAVFNHLRKKKK